MFENGGIKMQMCFFVDGSKYTVCKMLDEEAIAIYLPRKPHTFWTRPPKNLDKQFFCLVGMKVHFSWETYIACRRQSQKCIDWGLGDGNGGGGGCICLRQFSGGQRQTIQARIPFITRSTIVHLLFLDFPFFSTTPLASTNPPQSVFSPSVVCGG